MVLTRKTVFVNANLSIVHNNAKLQVKTTSYCVITQYFLKSLMKMEGAVEKSRSLCWKYCFILAEISVTHPMYEGIGVASDIAAMMLAG